MSEPNNISNKKKLVTVAVVLSVIAIGAFTYSSTTNSSPEFIISNITTQKDEIEMGETAEAYIKIKNTGGEKGKFTINLGDNERSVIIPAGGEGEISFSLNSDRLGLHEIELDNLTKKYLVYQPFPFLGAKVKYTASGQLASHHIIGSLTYEIVEISDNSFSAKVSPTGTLRVFIENGIKTYRKNDPLDWRMPMDEGELVEEIDIKEEFRNFKILHYKQQVLDDNVTENIGLYIPDKMNVPIAFYRETSSGSIRYILTETNIGYLALESENRKLENMIK